MKQQRSSILSYRSPIVRARTMNFILPTSTVNIPSHLMIETAVVGDKLITNTTSLVKRMLLRTASMHSSNIYFRFGFCM